MWCLSAFLAATAAAKSLEPCPTLCDPIDGSPSGSPSLGLRTQGFKLWSINLTSDNQHSSSLRESNKQPGVHKGWKQSLLLLLSRFSLVWLCVTPWTAAYQAPLYMGFSKQEYWSGLPFPSLSKPLEYRENSFFFFFNSHL